MAWCDAGLLHREVRKQLAAGRVDVAEAEALAAQIGKRANGALLAHDEQRMEALIDIALHERCDAVTRVRLHVGETTEIGNIERAVAERFDRGVVIGRNDQRYRRADLLCEIALQRRLLADRNLGGTGIRSEEHTSEIQALMRLS